MLRKLKINIYLHILTSSVKQKHGVQETIKKDHIVYVGGVEGVNWEIGIDIYTLICIK